MRSCVLPAQALARQWVFLSLGDYTTYTLAFHAYDHVLYAVLNNISCINPVRVGLIARLPVSCTPHSPTTHRNAIGIMLQSCQSS